MCDADADAHVYSIADADVIFIRTADADANVENNVDNPRMRMQIFDTSLSQGVNLLIRSYSFALLTELPPASRPAVPLCLAGHLRVSVFGALFASPLSSAGLLFCHIRGSCCYMRLS